MRSAPKKRSGTRRDGRTELQVLLDFVRPGDALVIVRSGRGGGIAMPIRPELRPLYPPHWRELSSHVRFERAGEGASAVAAPISPASAACRTGAGSTNKRRSGRIAVDVLPVGPTLWESIRIRG